MGKRAFVKKLSKNDSDLSKHGIHVSRNCFEFFPLDEELDRKNPRTTLTIVNSDGKKQFKIDFIYYNQKTRDEFRLSGFPNTLSVNGGDYIVFERVDPSERLFLMEIVRNGTETAQYFETIMRSSCELLEVDQIRVQRRSGEQPLDSIAARCKTMIPHASCSIWLIQNEVFVLSGGRDGLSPPTAVDLTTESSEGFIEHWVIGGDEVAIRLYPISVMNERVGFLRVVSSDDLEISEATSNELVDICHQIPLLMKLGPPADDTEVVCEIDVPADVSDEILIERVKRLSLLADDVHRQLGGGGLEVASLEIHQPSMVEVTNG